MRKLRIMCVSTICFSVLNAHAMTVQSNAAAANSALPVDYTCDGKDISPEVSWAGTPSGTKSYALIVSDPDAPSGTFYHWVLFNIPPNVTEIPEGTTPPSAIAGQNSFGKSGYKGPCPPKGASHQYIFTVYALDSKLQLGTSADAAALMSAMDSHVKQKANYTMIYSRWGS